jgi:GPI-anchor transamidase subunit K
VQFDTYEPEKMKSTPGVRSDLFPRPLDRTLLTDFFGGVSQAEVVSEEAIESHMKSTPAENLPDPNPGKKKAKAVKPFAVKLEEPSLKWDGITSATIRAWAGAGLIGFFIAWTTIGASRSS